MSATNLNMTVRDAAPGVRAIDIEGEITAFSEEEVNTAHDRAARDGIKAVILNFGGLEYLNSGGIGLLVTILIRARRSGHRLLAFGLDEHYRQIFTLTRLDEAIGIYDDESAALAAVD